MHNRTLDWDDIRYFLAVAREGSVNQAGRRLGVNHTTVARRTQAFEKRLGTRLFDRSRRGYALTQAGEGVLHLAIAMEEKAQTIDRELFGWDGSLSGPLKLASPHGFTTPLIAPYLPAFLDRYPAIELELLTSTTRVNLDAREADIALSLERRPPEHLIGRKVMPFAHAVYGSSAYIKSLRRSKAPADAIFYRATRHVPDWIRDYFPDARIRLRVDDATAMLGAAQAGIGLAYLPCYLADAEPDLRRLRLDLSELDWGIWILNHPDLRTTARVRACREFLVETLTCQHALIMGEGSRYSTLRPSRHP